MLYRNVFVDLIKKMTSRFQNFTQSRYWEYLIIVSRFLLAFIFLTYGFGKLTGGQFGISNQEMNIPIKKLPLFRVMWFLFDHEPIKTAVGILQITTAFLLIFRRTVILGVFFFVVIGANIVLMDISFMDNNMGNYFVLRFSFYFFLCGLILWQDRMRMKLIFSAMFKGNFKTKRFPIWVYFTIPISVFMLEFFPAIPKLVYHLITNPQDIIHSVNVLIEQILK